MIPRVLVLFVLLSVLAPQTEAATGSVWITPDTTYSQRDTSFTLVIHCDGNLTGVKGLQLDIDFNGAFIQPDTANLTVGSIWSSSKPLFNYTYLINTNSRLTLDFAVLGDTFTVNGPGTIAEIPINTVGFGETDVAITSYRLRDNQNQPMPLITANAWVKVCRFVGDLDADNRIDIADLTAMIDYLYINFNPPVPPMEVADVDCDNHIDISDITKLIDYLYISLIPICRKCL
jgi:hypothetical protein